LGGRGIARTLGFGALTLVMVGLVAPSADAGVTFEGNEIRLATAGAGAVVTRDPFRISFTDGEGHPVLSEVAGGEAMPLERSAIDPASGPSGSTLFAPLGFLVGTDRPNAFKTVPFLGHQTGEYSGDLSGVEESGVEYSAKRVTSARQNGAALELTLETNDPSGRTLDVTLTPQPSPAGEVIRVAAVPSEPQGVASMSDAFTSSANEAFHGFGGRHNSLDQHGEEFFNWVDQENVTTTPAQPENKALYPDGPQAAYYVQSSFVSNLGYGFFANSDYLTRWSLDAQNPLAWQVQSAGPGLEYVVAPGSQASAAAAISSITGRQPAPPSWALGPMMDREVEEPVETPRHYERQVASDIRHIASFRGPLSAYRIEGWGFLSDSTVEREIAELRQLGVKSLLYFRPFTGTDPIGTERAGEYEYATSHELVATNSEGRPYIFTDNFAAPAAVIDFTKPAAVAWWRQRIFHALELGAEGFMLDFGEQVQPDMHFANGMNGEQMHNLYPVLVQRTTRRIVEEFEETHPGRRIIFYSRAGYSGEPGSAAYVNFNFPGDETTDWTAAGGLAAQTPDMLNRALTGAYGFGTDIGGYLDVLNLVEGHEGFYLDPTTRELFLRWSEWAALTPIFRLHGAIITEHTPWSLKATGIYRTLAKLHAAAAPLISQLWQQADETGMPVTRPLYLAYPNDPQAAAQDQEWLLGPDVLVAPVVTRESTTRSVYFPEGCWRSPASGQQVVGPRSETVAAGEAELPFFFRCGTLPFRPPEPLAKRLRG